MALGFHGDARQLDPLDHLALLPEPPGPRSTSRHARQEQSAGAGRQLQKKGGAVPRAFGRRRPAEGGLGAGGCLRVVAGTRLRGSCVKACSSATFRRSRGALSGPMRKAPASSRPICTNRPPSTSTCWPMTTSGVRTLATSGRSWPDAFRELRAVCCVGIESTITERERRSHWRLGSTTSTTPPTDALAGGGDCYLSARQRSSSSESRRSSRAKTISCFGSAWSSRGDHQETATMGGLQGVRMDHPHTTRVLRRLCVWAPRLREALCLLAGSVRPRLECNGSRAAASSGAASLRAPLRGEPRRRHGLQLHVADSAARTLGERAPRAGVRDVARMGGGAQTSSPKAPPFLPQRPPWPLEAPELPRDV